MYEKSIDAFRPPAGRWNRLREAFCEPGIGSTCSAPSCPNDVPGALHCYGV